MKKSKRFVLLFAMFICSLICFLGANICPINTLAADYSINKSDFDDNLLSAIEKMYAELRGFNATNFDALIFYSEFDDYIIEPGTDGFKIQEDLTNGILNLTTGKNAVYECLKNRKGIKDITGLNYLKLDNITTLILDDNTIKNINSEDLASLKNLKKLSVKNNGLNSITINPDIKTISNLDLSHNNLTEIDLTNLSNHGDEIKCNLSYNNFNSAEDIICPNNKLSELNLSFNSLPKLSNEEWSLLNNKMVVGKIADVVVQVSNGFNNLTAGDEITIYKNNFFNNFQVVISYSSSSKFYNPLSNNEICYNNSAEDIETVIVPAGKVIIEFYSDGQLITLDNFPSVDKDIVNNLTSKEYSIKLKSPTVTAFHEGKEVKNLSQDGDIKVILNLPEINNIPNKQDILDSVNGANIFYYLEGKEPEKEVEFNVTKNGSYNYVAYVSFDDIVGEKFSFNIKRTDMSGIVLGIVIIVIIFVVCAAMYFIGKWIRNGAEVAPLSEKELFKVNRKRGYLTQLNKENRSEELKNLNVEGKEITSVYNQNQQEENESNLTYNYIRDDNYYEDEDTTEKENYNDDIDEDKDLDLEDEDFDEDIDE